jgi:antitoxin CcdA
MAEYAHSLCTWDMHMNDAFNARSKPATEPKARPTQTTDKAKRQPTNVSLPADLLDRARKLDINLSRACERGLREEVQEVEARRWAEQNTDLVKAYTAMVEREGLPLAKYRTF